MVHYRQKYCKVPKRHRYFLTKHNLIDMNQLRMSRERTGKISTSPRGTEAIVCNRCSYQVLAMVGKMLLQTKIISSTNQQCRPFQEEEYTVPQRLEPCVAVLLVWGSRLKTRWKMGSFISLIFRARPLMCLTKPFLP